MNTAGHCAEPSSELLMWLSSLRTLSAAANSDSDLREVLDLVAETARSLLGFDFCGVLTPGHDQRSLVITGWSGLSEDYVNQVNADRPVALDGTAPSSRAFHSGAPIAIRDIATESRFSPWGGVAREQGYRAIIAVPLVAGGQVLGTLNGYYAPVHTFTSHEVERLALLANHAAIALTSAQRLDQLHRLTESLLAQRDLLARSEQIHERFLAAALRSGGLDEIARILADLITRSVLVEDVRGGVLTSAGESSTLPDAGRRAEVRIGDTQVRHHTKLLSTANPAGCPLCDSPTKSWPGSGFRTPRSRSTRSASELWNTPRSSLRSNCSV
ncbi:GAF domain-containing protein [Rhodococcus koreensis]